MSAHKFTGPSRPSLKKPSDQGFALLIVITLLSFLVLLLVSLAAFTRVETNVASNGKLQEQARQNALMALNIAVGQLQKYAGPDNITTARADILAATPANTSNFGSYYTGVWGPTPPIPTTNVGGANLRPPSPLLTWLVSGNETSPLTRTPADAASAADDIFLVDKAVNQQATLQVRVRKQKINSSNVPGLDGTSVPIGNYAYWVGDEGLKAKINLTDPYASWSASTTGNPAMTPHTPTATESLYRVSVAQRFGIELMSSKLSDPTNTDKLGATYDIADGANANFRRDLTKLNNYNQLKILPGFNGLSNDIKANRFHDLTVSSYGLLTNSDAGGLREDLTWHFEHPSTSALTNAQIDLRYPNTASAFNSKHTWKALINYYAQADLPRPIQVQAPTHPSSIADTRAAEMITPAPVITQFRVFFSPDPIGNIRMRLAFVLANPYTEDLQLNQGLCFTFGLGTYAAGSARPNKFTVTTENVTAPATATNPLNILDQLVSGGASATTNTSTSYIYSVSGPVTLKSGEAQAFTLASDYNYTSPPSIGSTINLKQGLDTGKAIILPKKWTTYYTDRVIFSGGVDNSSTPAQSSRFGLKLWNGTSPTGGSTRPLQHFAGPAWPATLTQTGANGGGVSILLCAPQDGGGGSAQPYGYRNFRSPVVLSNDGTGQAGDIAQTTSSPNDTFATDLPLGSSIPWGNSNTVANGKTSVVTTAIPRRSANKEAAMMSLAEFRNVSIGTGSGNIASAIGNATWDFGGQTNGSSLNPGGISDTSFLYNEALWDRFYFSTIPQQSGDFTAGSDTLPNARLVVKSSTSATGVTQTQLTADQYAAARYLMINGPFNVNSTSVEAWKAFLASTKGQSLNGDSDTNVPFFRTTKQPGKSTNARTLSSNDAWNGYVNLTDPEINQLATRIVAEVKARGPFNTLGNFLNRRFKLNDADTLGEKFGALQQAIENVGINTLPAASSRPAYTGIPGYLTQGDILQAIGPVITTRSDTFVIRAYGDVLNPLDATVTTARAYCEAVVQRMQDPATTGDSITTPGTFGRRFVVVSFRWLSADEI